VVQALTQFKAPARRVDDAPLRMPVMRVHRVQGIGTVVSGRVAQGSVRPRDTVVLHPSGATATVVSIERFHGAKAVAEAGDLIGVALRGIKPDQVERGAVLSAAAAGALPAVGIYRFTARVVVLRTPAERELRVGAEPFLLAHTAAFAARIVESDVPLVKGARATVVFEATRQRVVLEPFAIVPALGRFAGALNEALAFIGAVTSIDKAYMPERRPKKHAM
jgi:translation elongation factor EF-1alpha